MAVQWFLNNEGDVSGPFSTEEVKTQIDGGYSPDVLIWGKAQKDWRPLSWWENALPDLLAKNTEQQDVSKWHFAFEGKSHGPLTRKALIEALGKLSSLQSVMLWTKGMKSWLSVYDFHDVMDEIGIDRRMSPRAEMNGTVVITGGAFSGIGQIKIVSEGGLGLIGLPGGIPGQEYQLEIDSPRLGIPIRAKAEVRYVTETGYTGMKFTQISMEAKSTLIDYIRRQSPSTRKQAA
ncbi:MAG: DUF4339 domain-containing protein [Bdellovibrionales bacterium]|nr:DUF4339 domain-containing protein [Bdellovibrionales bacterium]